MTQLNSLENYINGNLIPKSNIIKEKGVKTENANKHTKNSEFMNELNGIVEVRYGDNIYKTWKVKFIIQYIIKFLKEKYPNSIAVHELNKIDIVLLNNQSNDEIVIEIQKTPIDTATKKFMHSSFEGQIRKQLEDNIENYGKCLFFFDSEYLRYLQHGNIGKCISINLTWLVKLMRENTLKVFVIKYDGEVRELSTKDFDFLKNTSQICSIGEDNDERILNRNKLKIFHNVINGHKFTQEEIDMFIEKFDERINKKDKTGAMEFFKKNNNERCKLYGYILQSLGSLSSINKILDMNNSNCSDRRYAIFMGIFEIIGNYASGNCGNNMKFIDKFNVAQYFPGYLRREEHWLTYKGREMDGDTVSRMCAGAYKNAPTSKSLSDY